MGCGGSRSPHTRYTRSELCDSYLKHAENGTLSSLNAVKCKYQMFNSVCSPQVSKDEELECAVMTQFCCSRILYFVFLNDKRILL